MFSGRRRDHDCHHWVHALAAELLPDFEVLSLSMDTAIDGTLGNMLGPSYEHAVTLAQARAVALSFTGPPCETWTAARHIQSSELFGRGPQPLRSALATWGIPGLSPRELDQLGVGSQLMLHIAFSWS